MALDDDAEFVRQMLNLPSGSPKFRKRWIEFDCQKGVHHGKYATYEEGKRKREGHIGRFTKVAALGEYGRLRVEEFTQKHNCHYVDRFTKDLDECGIRGITAEGWPSGRSVGRPANGGLPSGSKAD